MSAPTVDRELGKALAAFRAEVLRAYGAESLLRIARRKAGTALGLARKQRGLTLRQAAALVGSAHSTIAAIERGEWSEKTRDTAERLARAYAERCR